MLRFSAFFVLAMTVCFVAFTTDGQAEDDAFGIYADIVTNFQKEKSTSPAGDNIPSDSSVPNLSGSWSSNSPYIAEAKIVDQNSELRGIVKVPNGGSFDLYHAAGLYYQGTIVLSYFPTSGARLFVGTLNGTTITGDLSLYNSANQLQQKLTGIVLTKNVSGGSAVATANLAGSWRTLVLSREARGEITSTVISGVGETIALLSGVVNISYGSDPAPYHFRGYLLNNGEIFLWNSNGADVRTLLGSFAEGQISGLLEQDAVTVASNVVVTRPVMLIPTLMLLENQ